MSSVAWTAIPQFATSTAYSVGQIVRPLTAPTFGYQYAFRCTTAGTSGAEPSWISAGANNNTITTGGATFTNVSGQSAYGWSAAAGNLWCMSNSGPNPDRFVVGDRVFVSSDHSESTTSTSYVLGAAAVFGVISVISVNRAGSVPPVAADALSGANITVTTSIFYLDTFSNDYWQGVTFTIGGTATALIFANAGTKSHYFRNCAFVFTTSTTTAFMAMNNPGGVTFDNTTVTFNAAGQSINWGNNGYTCDFRWINTPSATLGTVPTSLFGGSSTAQTAITCRGVDLNAITTTLYSTLSRNSFGKVLFDSCRIASTVVRMAALYNSANDEVELVNCFDGTNILSERHTPAGDVNTDKSTTMVGGAQDDVGLFSTKLVSSARSDFLTMTLDSFWMDVENTSVGASRTATVEIISSGSLNNTDINLMLEYQGTAGSSFGSFVSTLPSALTASAALAASTATWNNAPTAGLTTWNPADVSTVTLSGGNLVATGGSSTSGVRGFASFSSGKYYWEQTYTTINTNGLAVGIALASASLASPTTGTAYTTRLSGNITINGLGSGSALGIINTGNVIGIAVDFTAQLIWFRNGAAGQWNGSGTANPATGTGGLSISTISSGALFPAMFGGISDVITANFGAAAFSGAVPAGFTSGVAGIRQRLQTTFTPQVAGRVRGLVRLGKPSTAVWVNPQIIVT